MEGKEFNPLISPCNCTGTMGFIHLKCLKQWLDSKRSMKVHRGQVIIKFKKLDCELCKMIFPFQIAHNNRIVDIVEIEKPESDFIIFESLSSSS
jgi:E3 ubiquitin-protein ligase DOA10